MQGAIWLRSKSAKEQIGQGVNWPGSYWPICSRERIVPGANRLACHCYCSCFSSKQGL